MVSHLLYCEGTLVFAYGIQRCVGVDGVERDIHTHIHTHTFKMVFQQQRYTIIAWSYAYHDKYPAFRQHSVFSGTTAANCQWFLVPLSTNNQVHDLHIHRRATNDVVLKRSKVRSLHVLSSASSSFSFVVVLRGRIHKADAIEEIISSDYF